MTDNTLLFCGILAFLGLFVGAVALFLGRVLIALGLAPWWVPFVGLVSCTASGLFLFLA